MAAATDPALDEAAVRRSKAPFLRRVRIRGYKSIAFCDVTLEPLTILVGRNASGKSNFLDALGFLADLADMRITDAVSERKGWRALHCRENSSPFIEFELESTFQSYKSTWDAEYSFALEERTQNQIRVCRESLILTQKESERLCGYRLTNGNLEWIGGEHFTETVWGERDAQSLSTGEKLPNPRLFRQPHQEDRLVISAIGTQPFLDFSERLRGSYVYSFSPSAMRAHQEPTGGLVLTSNGSNLARAIYGIRDTEPDAEDRISRYLSSIVEEVEGFSPITYGDYETVQFRMRSQPGKPPQYFDASSVSDGTLRVLASLLAVYQIRPPIGESGFIAIEEPETSLHPAAMRALVDALDEATLRTQILLTTHSADMLDNPTIRPENIRVVQLIDGRTAIAPVDAASVDIVRRKLSTLGGLERDNLLEPDFDDLDRQRLLSRNGQEPKG